MWPFSRKGPSGFSSSSTAEQVTEGIDGSGLTAIVTGTDSFLYSVYFHFFLLYFSVITCFCFEWGLESLCGCCGFVEINCRKNLSLDINLLVYIVPIKNRKYTRCPGNICAYEK